MNDSQKALGSRIERHEHIGKGKIGLERISSDHERLEIYRGAKGTGDTGGHEKG